MTDSLIRKALDTVAKLARRHEEHVASDGGVGHIYVPPAPYRQGDRVLLEAAITDAKDSGNLVVQAGPQTFVISSTDLDPIDLFRHPPQA